MSSDLFISEGGKKFLTADELDLFIDAANGAGTREVRSFCLVLTYTG